MSITDEQRERWFAYWTNELPETDRPGVEAEMALQRREADAIRRILEETRAWAIAPVEAEPLEPGLVTNRHSPANTLYALKWPLGLAAAALFLLALSQTSFSITRGGTTFAWGMSADAPADLVAQQSARIDALEAQNAELTELVEAVALQAVVTDETLEQAASRLAYNQYVERETRRRDIQQLAQWVGDGLLTASYQPADTQSANPQP